ncbi:MAG: sigma-54-dependent Fis family transcriptional regulator, partial [Planctomycetes bacterium]|nr:sigma-54-dependent Fis family transcriptional regulator [Planctomycetota bacterium]
MRILIADDERGIRMTLEDDLVDAGFEVSAVADGEAAWAAMQKHPFDMMVTDIVMPKLDGLDLLERVKREFPETFTVMITGNSSDQRSRRALELGVNYYLEKPFSNEQVVLLAREAQAKALLAKRIREKESIESLVGASKVMQKVVDQVKTVAGSEFAVLITGPSGSGKERVANLLHANSRRAEKDFVVVHCGMYAETLIEDELFGHEAGAYTGATAAREGRFERANGGTIFLDDIDDMPHSTQVKLLRVLQEGEIERLGGHKPIKIDVRVIASTKVDLAKLVREGKFREDLFYRLAVIPIDLPALYEREG